MPAEQSEARPIAVVDAVIMTIEEGVVKLVLHRRPNEPFRHAYALPGGYIHVDEDGDAEDAIARVLRDKLGLEGFYFEQLQTFSGLTRDPRGWSISVAFIALVPREMLPGADDAAFELLPVDALPKLAFDHGDIVAAALYRLRGKGAYSTLPAKLLGEEFTLPELQDAYECVLGTSLDQSSFRRKIMDLDLIEETGIWRRPARGRPAMTWRLKKGREVFDRTLGRAG